MNRTRRAFLRAAVVSPVIAGAWVVWETETSRLKVRHKPAVCCVPGGTPNRSCTHPASAPQPKSGQGKV
jgi:hypothetical protein